MPSAKDIVAKDIMASNVVGVESGEHVSRVVKLLEDKKIHHVAVFEGKKYVGLFGYKELIRISRKDPESMKVRPGVKNYVIKPPKISPDTSLIDIADYLYRLNYKILPVFSGEKLAGVVSERDVMRALTGAEEISKRKAKEFMTPNPETVSESDHLGRAIDLMREHNMSRLPVTGGGGKVVGSIESANIMHMMVSKGQYGRDSDINPSATGSGRGATYNSDGYAPETISNSDIPVSSIMEGEPILSLEDEPIKEKLAEMIKRPEISTIVVVDGHAHPVGIISPKDIIHGIAALKERELMYLQISGLESVEGIDAFQKAEMHKAFDVTVKKIAKSENIHSMEIHVKAHHTSGKTSKYVIRARVKTDRSFIAVKNWGWDPVDASVKLMHEVEKIVLGGANKKRDVARQVMRDTKEAQGR